MKSYRYIDQFIKSKNSIKLLGIFPNAKEITESITAYNALKKYFHYQNRVSFKDKNIICLCPGDGSTPRTGSLIATHTAWTVYSIDPKLKIKNYSIRRLHLINSRIEDFLFPDLNDFKYIVVSVHSHAKLTFFKNFKLVGIVSIPCCVPDNLGEPTFSYIDENCFSKANKVNIYQYE